MALMSWPAIFPMVTALTASGAKCCGMPWAPPPSFRKTMPPITRTGIAGAQHMNCDTRRARRLRGAGQARIATSEKIRMNRGHPASWAYCSSARPASWLA